jgi:uncharacterized delta-60 repeat protein
MRSGLASVLVVIGLTLAGSCAPAASAENPLDGSFGDGGMAFPGPKPSGIYGLARGAEGQVIGVGRPGNTVWEFLGDGRLDDSFGEGGTVVQGYGEAKAALVDPEGRILVAGKASEGTFGLSRLNEDGSLEARFARGGRATLKVGSHGTAEAIARTPAGRILVAGWGHDPGSHWRAVVAAYRPDGTLDRTYARGNGHDGIAEYTTVGKNMIEFDAIDLLPDGDALVAGDVGGRVLLVRLNPDGTPDVRFGKDGIRYYDIDGNPLCFCSATTGLALDARGRAIVTADVESPEGDGVATMRLLRDARRDPGFGRGGVVRTFHGSRLSGKDVAVQKNGKILVVGSYNASKNGEARLAAARYLPDGRLDPRFGHRGFFTRDLGLETVAFAALALPEGRVVVAGRLHRTGERTYEWFQSEEPFLMSLRP